MIEPYDDEETESDLSESENEDERSETRNERVENTVENEDGSGDEDEEEGSEKQAEELLDGNEEEDEALHVKSQETESEKFVFERSDRVDDSQEDRNDGLMWNEAVQDDLPAMFL